ncbi:hypothetical protein ACJMK2_027917 [Sinanodonta woodiana]|uniref:CAF17 C-terminal domain-containing protein n=1 Tax=Sinanodonta woodiana TaxID=1069815 RepID=A0ABD3X7K2_SINWO
MLLMNRLTCRIIQKAILYLCTRCQSQMVYQKARVFRTKQHRLYSTASLSKTYKLKSRGLVQLQGVDVVPLLQGLVTSDVTQLGLSEKSQYSMLLNVQGRVLYDLILYDVSQSMGENCLLVECEVTAVEEIMKLIKKYKLRKKVEIANKSEELSVLATLLNEDTNLVGKSGSVVIETKDPRVSSFGRRIILHSDQSHNKNYIIEPSETSYHERRYEWGIPEGTTDLPPGNCTPLESNLVFMNGVSFDKGCYLGQELTARTHHTGVIRKRLMPVVFDKRSAEQIEPGETVLDGNGKSVGKFRNSIGLYGLALLRLADVTGTLHVKDKNGNPLTMKAVTPSWWPKDH